MKQTIEIGDKRDELISGGFYLHFSFDSDYKTVAIAGVKSNQAITAP